MHNGRRADVFYGFHKYMNCTPENGESSSAFIEIRFTCGPSRGNSGYSEYIFDL
jgi:hypothetical protein